MTSQAETADSATPAQLPLVAMASVLLGFLALQLAAFSQAGVFEYPLDDVYIHLAVAEQIAAGGYGVNASEASSAASSVLYPLLLVPAAGTEAQRYLPLLWNTLALAACGWLWGRILVQGGFDRLARGWGLVAAVLVPLAINLPGIAFTGMEHTLHAAAALAIVSGLLRLLDEDSVEPLLIFAIIVAPLLRFEAMALSLLAAGLLVLRGHVTAGLVAGAVAVALVGAFMAFLVGQGLDPLPMSVQAKLGSRQDGSVIDGIRTNLGTLLLVPNGKILMAALGAILLVLIGQRSLAGTPRRLFALVLLAALLAHMCFGKVGWLNRYENYILVAVSVGLLALTGAGAPAALRLAALLPAAVAAWVYSTDYRYGYPWATRSIHLQQAQMGRLAKEFHAAPIAVNDLGWVAWRNPHYVLDLYGLASAEALDLRVSDAPPGWADPLVVKHGVDLAVIFDGWIGDAVGPDWVRLGTLSILGHPGYATFPDVAIYATGPEPVQGLRDTLAAWSKTLPEGARYSAAGGIDE